MRPHEILSSYVYQVNVAHSSGQATKELSYYTVLANLLNTVGASMKPRIHCVIDIKNCGPGILDGGLSRMINSRVSP